MPRIPRYDSQLRLTTQSPEVTREIEPEAQTAKALSELGNTLFNIGAHLQEVDADRQFEEASLNSTERLWELEAEARGDPDLDEFESRYENKVKQIKQEELKGITSPRAREKFSQEYDNAALTHKFRIKKAYTSKLLDRKRAVLGQNVENAQREYFLAPTVEKRQEALGKIASLYEANARSNVISYQKAREEFSALKKELPEKWAVYEMRLDPRVALDRLNSGHYGIKDSDPTVWARLKEDAEERARNAIDREKVELSYNREETEQKLALRAEAGDLTERELDVAAMRGEAGLKGGVSGGFESAARRLIKKQTAKIDAKVSAQKYVELADEFNALEIDDEDKTTAAKFKDLAKFRLNVMEAMANEEIDRSEGRKFFSAVSIPFDERARVIARDRYKKVRRALRLPFSWLNRYSREEVPGIKADLVRDVMKMPPEKLDELTDEEIAQFADDAILRAIKRDNPDADILRRIGLYPDTDFARNLKYTAEAMDMTYQEVIEYILAQD